MGYILTFTGDLNNIKLIEVKGETQNYVLRGDFTTLESIPVSPLDTVTIILKDLMWGVIHEDDGMIKNKEHVCFSETPELKLIVPEKLNENGILSLQQGKDFTFINLNIINGCSGWIIKSLEDYKALRCPNKNCRKIIKYINWKDMPYKFGIQCPYCNIKTQILNSERLS